MKKIYTILVLFFALINNAQTTTYIPMPNGFEYEVFFGGPVLKSCQPFYTLDDYVYVFSQEVDVNNVKHGKILRVNSLTNQITIFAGEISNVPKGMTLFNGDIIITDANNLIKINNSTITLDLLISNLASIEFKIIQHFIYTNYDGGLIAYDLITNTYSHVFCNLNGVNNKIFVQGFYFYNNTIFCFGTVLPFQGQGSNKIITINNNIATVFADYLQVRGGPYFINNYLIYLVDDSITNTYLKSFIAINLINNTINNNFYTTNQFSYSSILPFVINNQMFINNNNQYFVSDGSFNATLFNGNIPFIYRGFVRDDAGYSQIGSTALNYNNKLFGLKDLATPAINTELCSFDGFSTNIINLNNSLDNASSAMLANNKMYFKSNWYPKDQLYQNDNGTFEMINHDLSDLVGNMFYCNGFIFTRGRTITNEGLYKININAALASKSFDSKSKFILYPNPTTSTLNIQSQNPIIDLKIIDITGRSTNPILNNNKVDVSNLANGIYLLEATTTNGTFREKFIKN